MSVLPPIDGALLPADVRQAPRADRERYQAALGFERRLVGELTKQLTATAGAPLREGPYAHLLGDAMADAVLAGGGIGLARTIYEAG
jgi:hypothetical protein